MVNTKNYEEVYDVNDKSKNWVKLDNDGNYEDDNEKMKNVKEGVGYAKEARGEGRYVCGRIKDGKREGHWREYAYTTNLRIYLCVEGVYRNGKKVGNWKGYYLNGTPLYDMVYKDNGEVFYIEYPYVGIFTQEGEGAISMMGTYIGDDSNMDASNIEDNSKKVGKWMAWYKNGQKEWERTYINGEPEGKWMAWHYNGQKAEEGTYVNGKEEGKWMAWHYNGQKAEEGTFVNGEPEGKWIHWYENGQKRDEKMYVNGKCVDCKKYDKNGNRIESIWKQ